MALTATVHHVDLTISDVDRGVYATVDVRLAQHPSETMRRLVTRLLAYGLAYEEGIAFSAGGVSSTDEPPLAVRDPTGLLTAWIEVGTPSAERLHKAAKASPRVAVYTHAELATLQREAATRAIHRAETIEIWRIAPALLDAVEARLGRRAKVEIARNDGSLYVTVDGALHEGAIELGRLA
jgi:uncharacterized protein YaeQ